MMILKNKSGGNLLLLLLFFQDKPELRSAQHKEKNFLKKDYCYYYALFYTSNAIATFNE